MGCDIHLLTEVMGDLNDEWTSFDYWEMNQHSDEEFLEPTSIYTKRDYLMFGVIAGVRQWGRRVQLIDRRGFPGDASTPVKKYFDVWSIDAHHTSWIGLNELNDLIERTDDVFIEVYVDESDYQKYINYSDYIPHMHYDAWSDSYQINFYLNRYLIYLRDLFIKHIEVREMRDGQKYSSDYSNYRLIFWFDN